MYRKAIYLALFVAFTAGLFLGNFTTAEAQTPQSVIVFSQAPDPSGGYYNDSQNGNDYDEFVWDDFTLSSDRDITEIDWRGAYDPTRAFFHQRLISFVVAIYPSIPAGIQPDVANAPLVEFELPGTAGETVAGSFGGVTMYDYKYVLPSPFHAAAATKYWLYVEAYQGGLPDWCISKGTGGDGQHFHGFVNVAGGTGYDYRTGDTAFTLWGPAPAEGEGEGEGDGVEPEIEVVAEPTPTPADASEGEGEEIEAQGDVMLDEMIPEPTPETGEGEGEELEAREDAMLDEVVPEPTPEAGEGEGEKPASNDEQVQEEVLEEGGSLSPTPTLSPVSCPATAATASTALANKLDWLRDWRDKGLLKTRLGGEIAAWYYRKQ